MATIKKGYVAKLTKDYLLVDSVQEMDRIKNITRTTITIDADIE